MACINLKSVRTLGALTWSIPLAIAFLLSGFVCTALMAQEPAPQSTSAAPETTKTADDELTELRKKIQQLDSELGQLRLLVAKLQRYREMDYLRDQLMREEQRAEGLQAQLVETAAKEVPLQKRIDEIEDLLRPQRLEQEMAGVGSTRPEEDRDAVRNRLGNEKRRLQIQIDVLRQSRLRFQSSLNTADAAITRLRQRLNEVVRPQ